MIFYGDVYIYIYNILEWMFDNFFHRFVNQSRIIQQKMQYATLCNNLQTMDSAQRQGWGRILLLVAGSQTTLWKGYKLQVYCKSL